PSESNITFSQSYLCIDAAGFGWYTIHLVKETRPSTYINTEYTGASERRGQDRWEAQRKKHILDLIVKLVADRYVYSRCIELYSEFLELPKLLVLGIYIQCLLYGSQYGPRNAYFGYYYPGDSYRLPGRIQLF